MRLIDADKFLSDNAVFADCEFDHPMFQETLRDIIDNAETAIELIRCKDCKHWYKDECSHLCVLTGDLRKPDFFCADGEHD